MRVNSCQQTFPTSLSARGKVRQRAHELLADAGGMPGWQEVDEQRRDDALATALMDVFRTSGSREVFDCLVQLTAPQLMARVRSRVRYLGDHLDPQEMLQDAYINIYRYPDKFDARRPSAFAAWSSTIVDNTIRRHLRRSRSGVEINLRPAEILAQYPDIESRGPGNTAEQREDYEKAVDGYRLFLSFYLAAFHTLSERERFVLQMVEVRSMRYAQLAGLLGIRPEALKMVVFRARKRIQERIVQMMGGVAVSPRQDPGRSFSRELALAC